MYHGWKARGCKPRDWEAQDWKTTQDWETQDWETQDDWKTQGWKYIRQKTSDRNSKVIRLEDLTKDPWQAPAVRQERSEKTSVARAKMQAAAEVSKAAATAAEPEMHHPQEDAKNGKYDQLEQRMLRMEEEFKGLKTCVQNFLHQQIKEQPLENKSACLPRWLARVDEEADSFSSWCCQSEEAADSTSCGSTSCGA